MGRDRFFKVLKAKGLLVERLPRAPRTTHRRHSLPVFGNWLKDRVITGPNRAYVADLTYILTEEGHLFLSLITDVYSQKMVGWQATDTLETEGCLAALWRALAEQVNEIF